MLNKFLSLLLLITISTGSFAKCNITMFGKVIEKENGKPLPYATLTIHSINNKTITGTISSDDGSFRFKDADLPRVFVLKISFIGFRDTTINLKLKDSTFSIDLGTIPLRGESTSLASAVVTARVPVIEQKLDKIVMNVSEAVSTQGSNALDVLKKAPGVSVDPSGNITLNGSLVMVWIDGRPSNFSGTDLEALLNGTDGSTIDKIEIIAHPPSRYDAAGSGGIINIRTKRNFTKGLNGSARLAYSGSPYETYYQSADGSLLLNHKGEKHSTSFTYSPRYNEGFNTFLTTTDIGGGNIVKSDTYLDKKTNVQSFKLSNDIFANKKNILGFVISGMFRETDDSTKDPAISMSYHNGTLIEDAHTEIDNEFWFKNLSANLNYTRILKEGHEVTVNADYFYYDLGRQSSQLNNYFSSDGTQIKDPINFKINSNQYINIRSIKADYEMPLKKSGKIEAGLKWAMCTTDNNLVREDKLGQTWQPNTNQSTDFYYTENISAAYFTIANQFSRKFDMKGGLRVEWTHAKGEWNTADTVTNKSYLNLFPTLFAGYNPTEKIRLGLSYTLRIERPDFEKYNPQKIYIDLNSSVRGNININPQYIHQFSLSFGILKHLNLGVKTQFIRRAIIQYLSLDNNGEEKIFTWDNFGEITIIGANAAITELQMTKWLLLNSNIFVSKAISNQEGIKSKIFANANINSTFLLPKDFKVEFIGWLQTGIPYGYFVVQPNCEFTLGIKKSLFSNNGSLTLLLTDIFGTNKHNARLQNKQFENYSLQSKYTSQRATITFNYRFGQSNAVKPRKVGRVDESARVKSGN